MFKERYSHEMPKWMRKLGIWRINKNSIDFNWGYFAPKFGFECVLCRGTYFNNNYALLISPIFGQFQIKLPFKTKLSEGCDMPRYGFCVHNNTFWIYTGGEYDEQIGQCTKNDQWITWNLPFFTWDFKGHWILDKNKKWRKIQKYESSWEIKWKEKEGLCEKHPFNYKLKNGNIQNRIATCFVEKRQWTRKWFPWIKKIHKDIDIHFNDEVGERTGSWKGGCVGCGYELKDNETIQECLKRMKNERKFK